MNTLRVIGWPSVGGRWSGATRRLVGVILALGLVFGARTAAAGVRVVATLPDLGAIAREVVGDAGTVTVLSFAAEDPHYVDPRPTLLVPLSRADLLIVNGMELEVGWLPPMLVNARNPAIQPGGPGYFDASTAVARLEVPKGPVARSEGDVHAQGNPHYAYEPRSGAAVAMTLAARLARLDPANAQGYVARATVLKSALLAFATSERARFDAIPAARRTVVSYHQSLTYLEHWLGLTRLATIEPLPGIPPSPKHVAAVLSLMKGSSAVVVQEEYRPRATSERLAQLTSCQLVIIPGGAREAERYLDRLRRTTDALHAAMVE